MLNYVDFRANYPLCESESAVNNSARACFWDMGTQRYRSKPQTLPPSCLIPPCCLLPLCIREDASQGNREVGEDRVLSKLKPNSFFSPTKPETTLLRFLSSLFFCFLLSQMPQVSVRASLCLFMCVASGCHLVYKLGRAQTWSGPDASSPGEVQCCRNALYTARTSEMSLAFLPLCETVEQSLLVFILDWLHPFW